MKGQRIENLRWQLWHLQNLIVDTDNAKSKCEFNKLSKNMGDKFDKDKGRSIEELEAPDFKINPTTEKLCQRAKGEERSCIESAAHASGRPLKPMQFTFSVDQPADVFSEAGPLSGVRRPDLKPSNQFRDTVHGRRPVMRARAAQQAESEKSEQHNKEDPPSLTELDHKPSSPPESAADSGNNSFANWAANNSDIMDNSYNSASLRFPTRFTSGFGPSALLFSQPSINTPLSYSENSATVRGRGAFRIPRPMTEVPLDEILKDMVRNELEGYEPGSPSSRSNSRVRSNMNHDTRATTIQVRGILRRTSYLSFTRRKSLILRLQCRRHLSAIPAN